MNKTDSQRERVLTMLKQGPTSSVDFVHEFILRFSARIHELRQAGHRIKGKRIPGTRIWLYTLEEEA